MVGSLHLLRRRLSGGAADRHRRARARGRLPGARAARGPLLRPGEKGILLNRGVARKLGVGVGGDGRRARDDGRRALVGGEAPRHRESGRCAASRPTSGARASRALEAVQQLLDAGDAAGVLVFRQKDDAASRREVAAAVNAALRTAWHRGARLQLGRDGRAVPRRDDRDEVRRRHPAPRARADRRGGGPQHGADVGFRADPRDRHHPRDRRSAAPRCRAVPVEGLLLGLAGAIGGALVGAGLVSWFARHGIPAFSEAQRYSYGGDHLYTTLAWGDLAGRAGLDGGRLGARRARPRARRGAAAAGRGAAARLSMILRLLSLALRNLLRAKRRNALAGGSMALGTRGALVIASGLADGITRQLSANLVAIQTGHLQLRRAAGRLRVAEQPLRRLRPGSAAGRRRPRAADRGGRARGRRRAGGALPVHAAATPSPAAARASPGSSGIEPSRETELRAAQPAISGRFLPQADDNAVYVAEVAARKLRVGRRRRASRSWCRRRRAR